MDGVSPGLGAIITANNYMHDVATGVMLVCFGAVWYVHRAYDPEGGPEARSLFLKLYDLVTLAAKISLAWILIGGVPRTIYYTRLEWVPAVGDTQVVAIAIKHVLAFSLVGTGIYTWKRIGAAARETRKMPG